MDQKILIIDDSPEDSEIIAVHLLKNGFSKEDIFYAQNYNTAKKILEQNKNIKCIFLDYNLPDGSGINFMKEHKYYNAPFVIVTGQGDESLAVEFMKNGAMDYLSKDSLDTDKINRSIHYAINHKSVLVEKEKLLIDLQESMEKVKMLQGILPICPHCHNIRNDFGYWESVELYIMHRTDAVFTNNLCPACVKILNPGYNKESDKNA